MAGNKVAVITDSIACIPRDLLAQYDIGIIPLNFYADGRIYKDGIDVNPSDAYKLFLKDPAAFKSSAASPGDCLEAYRKATRQNKDVFCVTIAARLSTTHNTAALFAEQVRSENPDITLSVFDSQTAAAAEGLIALAAARAARQGKNLDEVKRIAEEVRAKVQILAYMDTIRYIYRSGRVPRIASVAGSMLNIRPLFTISDGTVHVIGMVRSKKVGIERLIEGLKNKVGNRPVCLAVMHVYAEDDAKKLKERVAAEFNCAELWLTEFSPLMGYAVGTGTLGIAFYSIS